MGTVQSSAEAGESEDTVAAPPAWADAVTATLFARLSKDFGRSGFERARRKWGGELDCRGKRCLVLGTDAPLGRAIAEGLARCGATVHLTCPDLPDAVALRNELVGATGNEEIHAHRCDLRRFRSIRELASSFAIEFDNLDVLIHCTELLPLEHRAGEDGVEEALALMLGGSFLLPALLLPHLAANDGGQIIHVGSPEFLMVDAPLISLPAVQQRPQGWFDGVLHHARIKAIQQRLSVAWASRLHTAAEAHAGARVRSNGMHCGWHEASLSLLATPSVDGAPNGWQMQRGGKLRHSEQAADTVIWLAGHSNTDVGAPTGQCFFDRAPRPTALRPRVEAKERAMKTAGDAELWEWCEQLCSCPCDPEELLKTACPMRADKYRTQAGRDDGASSSPAVSEVSASLF
jgi:NAD(P)-dependent dehydrogenase (short-subunit alcohol dehydrogenase family)